MAQGPHARPHKGQTAKKRLGALGILKRIVAGSDVVLHLVDARYPEPSRAVVRMCKEHGKKIIIVVTKTDLVSAGGTIRTDLPVAEFSVKDPARYRWELIRLINSVGGGRKDGLVRVGVVGYPNVGKSSLINALAHRRALSVSPEAGHTRAVQWIRIGRALLSDTPGVIPERIEKENLVLMGSLNIEKDSDPVGVAEKLLKGIFADGARKAAFFAHFDVPVCPAEQAVAAVAKRRGRLRKGGEPNLEEAARMIVSEWQRGKIKT